MRKYIIQLLSLMAMTLCGSVVNAQTAYDTIANLVAVNNPELAALRSEHRAALAEIKVSNNPEDPEVEFGRLWGTNTNENKWDISISQTFDFPSIYSMRNKSVREKSEEFTTEYNALLLDKTIEAKQLLVNIAYCRKTIGIQEAVKENLDTVKILLTKAFENGESTILEVNKAKIEYANACKAVAETRVMLSDLNIRLAALCGMTAVDVSAMDVNYPVEELLRFDEYVGMAYDNPAMEVYNARSRRALIEQRLARMSWIPRFTLGYVHEREGAESFDGIKVGITLPFFSSKGKQRLAQEQSLAVDFEREAAMIAMRSEIEMEYSAIVSRQELLAQLRPVFSVSNHQRLLFKAFAGGELSAVSYLAELNYFREAEAEYQNQERDYYLSLVKLNRYKM